MTETMKYPEWQAVYLAAMTEVDDTMLLAKVAVAEEAIRRRSEALESGDERTAIDDAIRALKILVKDKPRSLDPD